MSLNVPSLLVVLAVAGCATQHATTEPAASAARAATQQWATAFNTCTQANAIASLYQAEALLWGTVSSALTTTPDAVLKYFERACTASPKPTVELGQFQVQGLGDVASSSGIYTFTIYSGGQARTMPARFSFTFRRYGDRWLIISHHSSLMPTSSPPPAPPPQPRS